MIETKILDAAVGVQRGDVIDKSETTVLPSLNNGVIAGHFKRGRMDKPFKVTSANYRSLLGHDPSNPSYLAVEDCFKQGVSELSILRTGSTSGGAGGDAIDWDSLPVLPMVNINDLGMMRPTDYYNKSYGSIEVNGVVYGRLKDIGLEELLEQTPELGSKVSMLFGSSGYFMVTPNDTQSEVLNIKITPEDGATKNRQDANKQVGFWYHQNDLNPEVQGLFKDDILYFRIQKDPSDW